MSKFSILAPRIMRDLIAEPHFRFDEEDAAAIVGNAAYECGGFELMQELKPVVKGSRGGYGWFQWTGPRRRAFEAWAKRKSWSIDSYEANYSFLIRELLGPEKKAVAAVKQAGRGEKDPVKRLNDKVKAFEDAFERAGVKAYAKRQDWARKALAAFRGTKSAPVPKPAPTPAPMPAPAPPPIETGIPASMSWIARLLTWLGILRRPTPPPVLRIEQGGPDLVVRRVQQQLQELGYAEVGMADGLMGAKTEAMLRAFAVDNGLQPSGVINDAILAALIKARPRPIAENRARTTARDLRQAGNDQAIAFNSLGWLGNLLGLGGVLGGLEQTGVFDSAKSAADTATGTLATVQGAIVSVIGTAQWVIAHWWLFAIVAGLWMVYRVTKGVLELVVLFRQGVLQRPSVALGGGWHGAR